MSSHSSPWNDSDSPAYPIRPLARYQVVLHRAADCGLLFVVRVLREPTLAARLAEGGRRTVEDHYAWRRVYPAWDDVYERALAGRSVRDAGGAARPAPTR